MKLYHTGIIVDDLEAAMASWSGALGLHWAPTKSADSPMLGPKGIEERRVTYTYSIEGPHHIELLEQNDPTPYLHLTGGRHIHHLGYLSEDIRADAERLQEQGFHMELSGVAEDGGIGRATFHHQELAPGMWIELVEGSLARSVENWLAEAAANLGLPFTSPFGD